MGVTLDGFHDGVRNMDVPTGRPTAQHKDIHDGGRQPAGSGSKEETLKKNRLAFKSQFVVAAFLAVVVLIPAAHAGVQIAESAPSAADSKDLVICSEPRPQICTQEYRIVCAQMQDGSFKEYSNGCTSCADPDVVGYCDGSCGSEK